MKFKVGDKVRIVDGWGKINGCVGTVVIAEEIPEGDYGFPYNLTIDDLPPDVLEACTAHNWLIMEDEIELVEG